MKKLEIDTTEPFHYLFLCPTSPGGLMELSLETVRPAQFTVPPHFGETEWRNYEIETVARNIVILSRRQGRWFGFTWEQYQRLCCHQPCAEENACLKRLVRDGSLSFKHGIYAPTDRFIRVLATYVQGA